VKPAIVHVASGREWRGGQRQVWLLARELGKRGVAQVVVTTAQSELARRLAADGVRVHPAAWKAGLDPRVLPVIVRELQSSVVLHAHDAHSLTLASLSAILRRGPVVVTRRVTFPLRHRYFWRHACRIIAISRAVREALLQEGITADRVVIIPSAVDPDVSQCSALDLRALLAIPPEGQLAVHLGALTPEKDQRTLILAAQRLVRDLPDLHWVIVGDGPLRAELQRQIRGLDLYDRVHLLGPIDDPHRTLAQADVFVLSSVAEGLGSSVLAAMARSVPVVATRVGGVPDLLQSGAGLLVEPDDPQELAGAVQRVLTDKSVRSKLVSTAGHEIEKYSVAAMADQVLSVYRSCSHSLDGS
jgi:glycosyltransferase involved in cell wall biosynthesis